VKPPQQVSVPVGHIEIAGKPVQPEPRRSIEGSRDMARIWMETGTASPANRTLEKHFNEKSDGKKSNVAVKSRSSPDLLRHSLAHFRRAPWLVIIYLDLRSL
jgi:hypothetical protein